MTKEEIYEYISPAHMWEYVSNEQRCRSNERASLQDIAMTHGYEVVQRVTAAFLSDLEQFVKARPLTEYQSIELCNVICIMYGDIRITEVPLFFARLKSGRYGKLYSTIDTQDITAALYEFAAEGKALRKAEREAIRKQAEEEEREASRKRAIRWEQAVKEGLLRNMISEKGGES